MSTADVSNHGLFEAENDVSKLCRRIDWDNTPLGSPDTWPDALRTAARMVLESRFPMALGWGDDFAHIYNDGYVPILGEKHPDALGHPFSEVYAEIWDETGPQIEQIYAQGESVGFEDRFFLIDRHGFLEETYFSFSYSPVRDGAGDIVGLLVTSTETTSKVLARRRAESLSQLDVPPPLPPVAEILEEYLALLETAHRDIPWCAAFAFDAANEERHLLGAFGLRASDAQLGAALLEALSEHGANSDDTVVLSDPLPGDIEPEDERPPSTKAVWLPIYTDHGPSSHEVGGLLVGVSDRLPLDEPYRVFLDSIEQSLTTAIQERIYRDTQLAHAERRYAAVFEHALDPMMVTAPDGRILEANPAACELLGRSEEQLCDLGRKGVVDPGEGRLEAAVAVRAATGVFRGELDLKHQDGHIIPCELSSKIYRDARDEPRTTIVFRDLRERLQIEARLRQAQKLEVIGKLAGGVAHDFNNLLTAIDASAQFLEDDVEPDTETAGDVAVIRAASERAAALTQRLLAFSRQGSVEATVLNPAEIIEGLNTILRSLLGESIELIIRIEPDVRSIYASRQSVEQVLLNLVVNANDAMPDGGKLRLEIANRDVSETPGDVVVGSLGTGEYVELTVVDNGPGLTAQQPGRLFEPFYSTKRKGTGLGLATVADIVRDYSGAIRVVSVPDVETRFEILLPASTEPPVERHDEAPVGTTVGPLSGRVLLIEDQARVRKVTTKMLERAGLDVTAAAGGHEAIALVEDSPTTEGFDVVISDIVMPKMDGVEAVRRLRELDSNLKFLFISGYPDDLTRGGSRENPVRLLRKPFTRQQLLAAVGALVE